MDEVGIKRRLNVMGAEIVRLQKENRELTSMLKFAGNEVNVNRSLKEKTDSIAFGEIAKMNDANQALAVEIVALKDRLRKYEKVE